MGVQMRINRWWLGSLLVFACALPLHAQQRVLSFKLTSNDYASYRKYLDGRDPLDQKRVVAEGLTRHSMEILVFQMAPVLGGCGCKIEYAPFEVTTTNARMLADVKSGREVSLAVAGFRSDPRMEQDVYVSDAVLDDKDFMVGLFTHSSRKDLLKISAPQSALKLAFVAVESWDVDLQVLRSRGVRIVTAPSWASALKMLDAGRADVILQPFSNRPDFSFDDPSGTQRYLPLPGLKMNFGHGRYYFVSKKHPDGAKFIEHLNAGLRKIKANGLLTSLQKAAGLVDERLTSMREIP